MKNVARIKEQSATAGLSSYDLASSGSLYRRLRDEFASGERVRYYAASAADFEEGIGVLTTGTPDTLSRDTIIRSSQSGAKISWPAGTRDIFIDPLPGTVPMQDKSATYTVTIFDHGSLIRFTGTTATLNLPAAATVGDGFSLEIKNDGSGAVTVDPNGAELINGASTVTINAGSSGFVRCNGTAWHAIGFATLDINGLTTETAIDPAADFIPFYDVSAGANRKVLPNEIPGLVVLGTGYTRNPINGVDWDSGNIAHGLGVHPSGFFAYLQCVTAELNYTVGDRVRFDVAHYVSGASASLAVIHDATNIRVRWGNNSLPQIPNKTTLAGGAVGITAANWSLTVTPYRITT
jgi:hypothetical protein